MIQDSIWYYRPGKFKEYIRKLAAESDDVNDDDNDNDNNVMPQQQLLLSVSDILQTFREIKCVPDKFKQMSVKELSSDVQLIEELYKALRNGMEPESLVKFKLSRREQEERKNELCGNISKIYDINLNYTKAEIVAAHHRDEWRAYNYMLEVVIAPFKNIKDDAGKLVIIGNINNTPSIDGGQKYFDGGHYTWNDNKEGYPNYAGSITSIMTECGFVKGDYVDSMKRKIPCLVFINLKCPCPDWLGSAGKTEINLGPFQDTIAQTVSKLAYKMPTYRGMGFRFIKSDDDNDDKAKYKAVEYLRDFLRERYKVIKNDASLKRRDRLTQRGVFYRIRNIMLRGGYQPKNATDEEDESKGWGATGKYIADSIRDVCEQLSRDEWHERIEREDLGIIAGARATLYFEGQRTQVTIDNYRELAAKGIIMIVIEKEGIPELLVEYADQYGIALVQTHGRFTMYGIDLIEEAKRLGSVVGLLLDYDDYGDKMAKSTTTKTSVIGINKETITWLQNNGYPKLRLENIEERYKPKGDIEKIEDEYLRHHRIELDAIVAEKSVGAEGLWKYIVHRLESKEISPNGFDLNKVISMPANEVLYPKKLSDFLSFVSSYVDYITEDKQDEIIEELGNVEKLTKIDDKSNEVDKELSDTVKDDGGMTFIISETGKLFKRLRKVLKDEYGYKSE